MEMKHLLDEEIERLLSHINTLAYGSDEREGAIDELNKLHKLRIDEIKAQEERSKGWNEEQSKKLQHREQVIERYFRYGAIALELIVPIVAYGVWYHKGLKFEETGIVTSSMTKNLISKMLPKKK